VDAETAHRVSSIRRLNRLGIQSVFDHDDGQGGVAAVGQGQRGAADSQQGGAFEGTSAPVEGRSAARLAPYLDLRPGDAVADAGAERLRPGLLRRKAGGEALRGVLLALTVGNLAGGEDAAEEALAEAVDARGDPCDLDEVGAQA